MSDYKQTRDAAGNVTSQYGQMLRNLDDDLVERLHDRRVCSPAQNSCRNDHVLNRAADRIEELERAVRYEADVAQQALDSRKELKAKLAKAVEALEKLARLGNGDRYGNSDGNMIARNTLAKLKGEADE
jgi:hypothetical protein